MSDRPRRVETTGEFLAEADEAFGFLRECYNFGSAEGEQIPLASFPHGRRAIADAADTGLDDVAAIACFSSSAVCVQLINDPRGEITCQLWHRAQPSDTRVDLWHLLQFAAAPETARGDWVYEYGTTSLRRGIQALAMSLREHGERWLRGEPHAWAALRQWLADSMPPTRPDV